MLCLNLIFYYFRLNHPTRCRMSNTPLNKTEIELFSQPTISILLTVYFVLAGKFLIICIIILNQFESIFSLKVQLRFLNIQFLKQASNFRFCYPGLQVRTDLFL
jgi:hypothetical protein